MDELLDQLNMKALGVSMYAFTKWYSFSGRK